MKLPVLPRGASSQLRRNPPKHTLLRSFGASKGTLFAFIPVLGTAHSAKAGKSERVEKKVNDKGLAPSGLSFSTAPDGLLLVGLKGDWKIGNALPSPDEVEKKLKAGTRLKRVGFDTSELKAWDSGLLTFLTKVKEFCSQNKIPLEAEGLPEGARGLLKLASAVAERKGAREEVKREPF